MSSSRESKIYLILAIVKETRKKIRLKQYFKEIMAENSQRWWKQSKAWALEGDWTGQSLEGIEVLEMEWQRGS